MTARDRIDPGASRELRGAISLDEIRRVAALGRRRLEAVALVVHVQRRIARERIGFIDDRRVEARHQHHPLSRMRGERDISVGGRQIELVQIGRTAAGRRGHAITRGRARLRVVVREQRAAAGVAEHHDFLEPFLFAQESNSSREIEQEIFVEHHRVVVQVAGVEAERGKAGVDPERNGIVGAEVGARMRHDHDGARPAAAGRHIEDSARLAEVGGIELHGALKKRRVDISEIDRVAQLVVGGRLRHVPISRTRRQISMVTLF